MSTPAASKGFTRLEATVSGYVQGVNFRWFTQREATALRLVGYVRNSSDGTVEVVAEGPREALEELVARLRIGPSAADVQDVRVNWDTPHGGMSSFQIRL